MNNSTPYLLSVATPTPNFEKHKATLSKLGEVEHIFVELDKYPGHLEKYFTIPKDLDPERYVIFLDTDDVLVQAPLPELKYDLYLSAENVLHCNTMWAGIIEEHHEWEALMNQEVFNCGTWAMKVKTMYEYIEFLRNSMLRYTNLDQLHFNQWLRQRPELSRVIDPTIFCALFSNYYTNKITKDDEGWKCDGKLISIVHANGDVGLKERLWM